METCAAGQEVSCASCAKVFCRDCVQQYLLNGGLQMSCPDCAQPWSDEFVDAAVSDSFRHGDLRKHREKLLVDMEKVRLSEFQEQARRYAMAVAEEKRIKKEYEDRTPNVATYEEYLRIKDIVGTMRWDIDQYLNAGYMNTVTCAEWDYHEYSRARPWTKSTNERIEHVQKEYDAEKAKLDAMDKTIVKKGELEKDEHGYAPNVPLYISRVIKSLGAPVSVSKKNHKDGDKFFGAGWRLEGAAAEAAAAAPKQQALRGCPAEGCRGFLSVGGICGLCDAKICLSCHEIVGKKGEAVETVGAPEALTFEIAGRRHICNKDSVETAKLLAKETRSCPSCKACIYKTDGCDQMWCTQCKTTFSWRTGKVETGRVHNPHYYEWLRRTQGSVPREEPQPGDVGYVPPAEDFDCCRPETELVDLPAKFFGLEDVSEEKRDVAEYYIRELHRHVHHLGFISSIHQPDVQANIAKLNVRYLAGEMVETEWRRRIFIDKRAEKRRQTYNMIVLTLRATLRDVLNSYILGRGTLKIGETITQCAQLITFSCEAIADYKKRFNYSGIDDESTLFPNIYNIPTFPQRIDAARHLLNMPSAPSYEVFAKWVVLA